MGRMTREIIMYGALLVTLLGMTGCGSSEGGAVSTSGEPAANDSGLSGDSRIDTDGGKQDVPTGTATVTWNAPNTRTDGSYLNPASDLSVYRLYYGTVSGTYTHVVEIPNPGTSVITYTLNLPSGATYYFTVTDVDASGQESERSNEGTKTL